MMLEVRGRKLCTGMDVPCRSIMHPYVELITDPAPSSVRC
jgi:hypothetical protein